jgi:predicted  nucleic acid-binding Zn-ribbon protein
MAKQANPTLQVLREIRDELRKTNERLDGTNQRLERVEGRVESLERRQSEGEIRLASELVAVAKAVQEVRDLLRDNLTVQHRVDDHERRIAALERRADG